MPDFHEVTSRFAHFLNSALGVATATSLTATTVTPTTLTPTNITGTVADSAPTTKTGTFNAADATVTLPTRTAYIDLEERLKGADGADLALSETAGDFFRNIGTNQWFIDGEATINETELSEGWFVLVLPE